MSSLPTEVDFTANPAATPARMDIAMTYLLARIKVIEALAPDYQAAIDQLNAIGLSRITEVLSPLFTEAQDIVAAIEAIKVTWENDATIAQVEADVEAAVTAAFADYRNNYLGALSAPPTLRPDGTPVVVGCLYFDTGLDQMQVLGSTGWKNAGSSVAGVLRQLDPIIATAGQTVFTVSGGYDSGYLIATVNGVVLQASDFVATDGSTVTLATGLAAGDEFGGVAFGAVTFTLIYTKAQADARFALIGASYTKAQSDANYPAVSAVYSKSASDARYPNLTLSNITDQATARGNIGVGSAGTRADAYFIKASDITYGSNTNGYWRKTPNGDGTFTLECWGTVTGGSFHEGGPYTKVLPQNFADTDYVFDVMMMNPSGGTGESYDYWAQPSGKSVGSFTFTMQQANNGANPTSYMWRAIGKAA